MHDWKNKLRRTALIPGIVTPLAPLDLCTACNLQILGGYSAQRNVPRNGVSGVRRR